VAWVPFCSRGFSNTISQGVLVWHLREGGNGFLRYLMSLIILHEGSQDLRSRFLKLVFGLRKIRNQESARRNYGSFGPDEVWNLIFDTQSDKSDDLMFRIDRLTITFCSEK